MALRKSKVKKSKEYVLYPSEEKNQFKKEYMGKDHVIMLIFHPTPWKQI